MNPREVVVGRIRDDLRMDYTAEGHTVGSRGMGALAAAGKAYLTGKTAERVKGYFELEDLAVPARRAPSPRSGEGKGPRARGAACSASPRVPRPFGSRSAMLIPNLLATLHER